MPLSKSCVVQNLAVFILAFRLEHFCTRNFLVLISVFISISSCALQKCAHAFEVIFFSYLNLSNFDIHFTNTSEKLFKCVRAKLARL